MLRALDQLDLIIGAVLRRAADRRRRPDDRRERARDHARAAGQAGRRCARPGSHTWVHGLPLKMRFKRSKIYVSAIPVWVIGFIIGFIGAIMGIGGGFLLVPMLIYFLRVPTATVIGTSMVLTLITMASATVMHAATNHLVDAVLALILMVGGVIGAQFGARAGQKHARRAAAAAARPAGARGRPALRLSAGGAAGRSLSRSATSRGE